MDSFAELWEMVKDECKKQVSESIYNVWFKDMELVSFNDHEVVIALWISFLLRLKTLLALISISC